MTISCKEEPMPTIEISQEHYDRLMAFKPVIEQVIQDTMSDSAYADFVVFSVVERPLLESAKSADLQVIQDLRKGDSAAQAALNTLQAAQLTLQGLSRHHPKEVFTFLAGVWQHKNTSDRQDKGLGFHVLWERYRQTKEEQS